MKTYPAASGTVRLLDKPAAPCNLVPDGIPGRVRLNGTVYALVYLTHRDTEGTVQIDGYRLLKGDGQFYDLPESLDSCECHDFLTRTREGGCKHCASLRKLRDDLGQIA